MEHLTVNKSICLIHRCNHPSFSTPCQINFEENSIIFLKKVTSAPSTGPVLAPYMPDNFCTIKPLSSADAKEERLLLDSIAWPETPPLPAPFSLNQTSNAAHSTFTILPRRGGGDWHVGDQLEVIIQMYNFQGNPKKSGGDAIVARVHNRALEAGVAGRVVDHLNGSYSAVFSLLWEGSVTLVHSSEAVTVLRRLNRDHPDRVRFQSVFCSGSISESTICNVCLRQTSQPQCNYTDLHTGDPWFCYKPKNLSCDARFNHMTTGYNNVLKTGELKLFQSKSKGIYISLKHKYGVNQDSGKSGLSGYYYQGVWRSLSGFNVHQFNNDSAISQCLKGKVVHMYGDSTIRQFPKPAGPYMMWENANKIMVTYRIHGLPLRISIIPTSKECYVSKELDTLVGGTNTVVVLGIWAHFSTFPIELYIRRLQSIRRAVVRLLNRAPGTLVVIRTGTLQAMHVGNVISNGDWFSFQVDKVPRAMFNGLNVQLVDAWDMVLAHHLPHNIHPKRPIIKNMVDVLLSYICPQKKR
uniref:NXPE C-terminal domain-containing protein n=1 Tax=Labrus bergylta TaxID=56723 RepID=A0A3Q3FGX5_9LABR